MVKQRIEDLDVKSYPAPQIMGFCFSHFLIETGAMHLDCMYFAFSIKCYIDYKNRSEEYNYNECLAYCIQLSVVY